MTGPDEGGEAPCFAHLFEEPPPFTDEQRAERPRDSTRSERLEPPTS